MRFRALCVIILITVAILNLIPFSVYKYTNPKIEHELNRPTQSTLAAHGVLDQVLLEDDFSAPLGVNYSLWNLNKFDFPTFTWIDNDNLAIEICEFTSASLESIDNYHPETIAKFDFSFTQGCCYFGIGWIDHYNTQGVEWFTNLRTCDNGVFIDYFDAELYLVSYAEGVRVATPIMGHDLTTLHTYTLSWHSSYVSLDIDGELCGKITRHIPSANMKFILTASGHHYLAGRDTLLLDKVTIGTLDWVCQSDAPEISLIWPGNTSQVYDFDLIDLEIVGQSNSTYSWDDLPYLPLHIPWDIEVPQEEGFHTLDIYSETSTGNSSTIHLQFEVVSETPSIGVWASVVQPTIDGMLSVQEQNAMTSYSINMSGEDRQTIVIDILVGYYRDSLYVGMITPVPDRWNSRISILIDGNGTGIWGDAETLFEDIRITATSPSYENKYKGIYSYNGIEIQVTGITYSAIASPDNLVAEFLVPLASPTPSDIGLGIICSSGGYDAFYPVSIIESSCCVLQIAQNLGSRPQDTFKAVIGPSIILIGFCSIIIGVVLSRKKRGGLTIEETLEDEPLERIRILILSHPNLSLERLALLADTNTHNAREVIAQLQKKGLLDKSITISETEIKRESEKNHM